VVVGHAKHLDPLLCPPAGAARPLVHEARRSGLESFPSPFAPSGDPRMRPLKKSVLAPFPIDEETHAIYTPRHREFGYDWSRGPPRPHQRIVHGVPITPRSLLKQLAGASFCVSFAAPDQLDLCMQLLAPESILLLDNGAYSHWKSGEGQIDREIYWDWSNTAQECSELAIAVIPDVIGGSEEQNWLEAAYALREGYSEYPERTMFIWHMDESLERLRDAARLFNFIGIGSCAEYDIQKYPEKYLKRLEAAYVTLAYVEMRWDHRPYVHLMRGISMLAQVPWAQSADSTNIARNHHRHEHLPQHVREMGLALIRKLERERARLKHDNLQREAQCDLFAEPADLELE
jgi:hypothetical protein